MKQIFNGIHQIGLVVRNIKETIEKYTNLYGIYPWNIWEYNSQNVKNMKVYGRRTNYKMILATCKSSNIDLEIIEPLDNKSTYSEYLKKNGEGLHHINYTPLNYYSIIKLFKKNGLIITQYGNFLGRHKYAYFNSENDLKHIVEISLNLQGFKRQEPKFSYPNDKKQEKSLSQLFYRIEQIGIIVKDIKETKSNFENKYGIYPWTSSELTLKPYCTNYLNEQNITYNIHTARCKTGETELKLIQPIDKHGIFFEYLKNKGEGLHHISFSVKDFDKTISILKNKGIEIKFIGLWNNLKYAFVSTESDLKFVSCIYERDRIF